MGLQRRVLCRRLGLDGIRGLFASQPGHFSIQICDNRGQPLYPLCGPFAGGESYLLGILVSKEAFSQRLVKALYDTLVHVDVNPTAPNLDRAHELTVGVNLKELRPPQGASLVNPNKALGDLCRSFANQELSRLEADGDVNDRESVMESFLYYGRGEGRAGRLDGPRLAPPRQTSAVVYAVGRGGRSARWPAF